MLINCCNGSILAVRRRAKRAISWFTTRHGISSRLAEKLIRWGGLSDA